MRVHVSPQPFIRFHTYDDCVCLWFLSLFTHALSIGPMAITVNTFFHGTAFIFRFPIDYLCVIAYFLCMLRTKENVTMTTDRWMAIIARHLIKMQPQMEWEVYMGAWEELLRLQSQRINSHDYGLVHRYV